MKRKHALFQGFSADHAYYIAAFFPVMLSTLPDTSQMTGAQQTAFLDRWQEQISEVDPPKQYLLVIHTAYGIINCCVNFYTTVR